MTTERVENRIDTEKKPIIHKFTGVAVAAAVLALNGALIFGIISMRNRNDLTPGSAESDLSVTEESAPDVSADTVETSELTETEAVPASGYAELFRQYFEWESGEPQPYDYSDVVGTDLNETWEFENCTARLHAAVSDGIVTYFLTSVTGKTEDFNYNNLSFVLENSADQHQATEVSNETMRGTCLGSAERPALTDPNEPQTTWRIYTVRPENPHFAEMVTQYDASFFYSEEENGYANNVRTFSVNPIKKGGYFAVTLDSGENVGGYFTPFGMLISKSHNPLTPVIVFRAEESAEVPVFMSGWNADYAWIEYASPISMSDAEFIQVGDSKIPVPVDGSESSPCTTALIEKAHDETETTTVQDEFAVYDKEKQDGMSLLADMSKEERSRSFAFGIVTVDSVTFDTDGTPRVNYSIKFNKNVAAKDGDNVCLLLTLKGFDENGHSIDITANENPDINTQHCDADGIFRCSMRLEANYQEMPNTLYVEARLGLLLVNGTDENGNERGIYQCLPINESKDPENDDRFYITRFYVITD